jgi:nitrate reductase beta subunit
MLKGIEDKVKFEFEKTFMFYLPRICEHCLNPACAASCPSGAIYKRSEDGIVLVDQDRCRGWRMCISGCPYKKVYFNHKTGKAEKCTFCYPRIEVGLPTVCSETCVGRLRYIGLVLYDADQVLQAASVEKDTDLYAAQRACFLDPDDPEVQQAARAPGSRRSGSGRRALPGVEAHQQYEVALPLHPEYRTMPMVWYIPPLSPVVDVIRDTGHDAEDAGNLFAAIDTLRIPVEYLANLFTAGDTGPVDRALRALAAMRSYMRERTMGNEPGPAMAQAVGMSEEDLYEMFRLLAIAKYADRYVIPTAHAEQAHALEELATECALDSDGGVRNGPAAGRSVKAPAPDPGGRREPPECSRRARPPTSAKSWSAAAQERPGQPALWDGKGIPEGLFPPDRKDG